MTGPLGKVWVVSIPMRTPFRGVTNREALVFRGERFAEWSPFVEYEDSEANVWLKAALSWANDPLPEIFRESIGINATLPAVKPDQVSEVLKGFAPFKTVKIKVAAPGESIADDLARIQAVTRHFPEAKIRLDANGGYSVSEALELVEKLGSTQLEYLEQPVATVTGMAKLRESLTGSGIKIAADESIRKSGDPDEVLHLKAADILMLKAQPLGGIQASLEIANRLGLEVVVSSALETSLGIAQGLYLAAALPELNYDCGLGTVNLLAGDVTRQSLKPVGSELEPTVPEVDLELLEKFAASPERTKWWHERLARCLDL